MDIRTKNETRTTGTGRMRAAAGPGAAGSLRRRTGRALAGAAMMAATATGLPLSMHVGLFGFRDSLAVPYAGLSLAVECASAGVLVAAAGIVLARRPWRSPVSRGARA